MGVTPAITGIGGTTRKLELFGINDTVQHVVVYLDRSPTGAWAVFAV
jgi:hypothetical protein